MVKDRARTVLERMTGAARPEPDHGVVTLAGSLRLAASRAGHEQLRLRLTCGEVTESRLTVGGVSELLPERGLIVFLRGRGGACGIAALDRALVASILEARTTGTVSSAPVPDRAPTQTDATLVRGFLEAFMAEMSDRLDGRAGLAWAAGFQPRERVPDPDRLRYLMPDIPYCAMTTDIDVGMGVRRARITILLPKDEAGSAAGAHPPQRKCENAAAWGADFGARVRMSPAELDAVLCHLRVSLGEVESLEPGSLLRFPRDALAKITLTAPDGSAALRARLGQSGGKRAVKISVPPHARIGATGPDLPMNALDTLSANEASDQPATPNEAPSSSA